MHDLWLRQQWFNAKITINRFLLFQYFTLYRGFFGPLEALNDINPNFILQKEVVTEMMGTVLNMLKTVRFFRQIDTGLKRLKNKELRYTLHRIKEHAREERAVDIIRQSEYFDPDWYLAENVDLQGTDIDPARHFLLQGGFERRDPSPTFCSEEYYYLNVDVMQKRVNPLFHYEKHGHGENRSLYGFEQKICFPVRAVEAERIYNPVQAIHKRVAVLACFMSDGIISETLLFLINGLREVVDQIIVIGDCPIYLEELDKLSGLVVYARFERHEQFDFGSYKRGLDYARKNGYLTEEQTDELVFVNDSCYGPVFPFSEVFNKMSAKAADFWGLRTGPVKRHVSSYFMVFRRRIIDAQLVDQFLGRLYGTYDRMRAAYVLEYELSAFFRENGMHMETYVDEKGNFY